MIDHRQDPCQAVLHQKATFHLSEDALTTDSVYHIHKTSFPLGKVPDPTLSSLRSSLRCLIFTHCLHMLLKGLTFAEAHSNSSSSSNIPGSLLYFVD